MCLSVTLKVAGDGRQVIVTDSESVRMTLLLTDTCDRQTLVTDRHL